MPCRDLLWRSSEGRDAVDQSYSCHSLQKMGFLLPQPDGGDDLSALYDSVLVFKEYSWKVGLPILATI